MSRPVPKKVQEVYKELIIYVLCLLSLLLSSVNINRFLTPKKVLGVATEKKVSEREFWEDFVNKNPNYIPGWIELGRQDRVREIDPNYIRP